MRLLRIYRRSLDELKEVLSPDLRDELDEVFLPLTSEVPSESELRIAQAQLVGWLEGLFHGIQASLWSQQMAAQAQLAEVRQKKISFIFQSYHLVPRMTAERNVELLAGKMARLLAVLKQPASATFNVSQNRGRAKTVATLAYLHNGKLDYPARILRYMQDPELHGLIFSVRRKPTPELI